VTWTQHKQTSTRLTWYTCDPYTIKATSRGDYEARYGDIYLGSAGLLGGAKNLCEMHHQLKESVNV
jgi:hypothetical protein